MADIRTSLGIPGADKLLKEIGSGLYAEVMALAGGAYTASATFTPTAAAYGAGDIMDVAKEFSFVDRNGLAVPAGSIIRILTSEFRLDEAAVASGQTSYSLPLFTVTPPSAQADNAAWSLSAADLASYVGSLFIGTPVDLGATQWVKTQYLDLDVKLAGTSLFGRLVTAGAHTAAAVARSVTLLAVAH
jgi:hypothetical protein